MYGLNPSNGRIQWMRDAELPSGIFTPRLLHDKTLVGLVDDTIVGLDAMDGDREWTYSPKMPDMPAGHDCWMCAVNGDLFAVTIAQLGDDESRGKYRLVSLSLKDGNKNWQQDCHVSTPFDDPMVDPADIEVSRPIISGDSIFVESGTTPRYLMTDGGHPYYSGYARVGSGTLRAFDVGTGNQRWRCALDDRATSLAATNERIYLGVSRGTFHSFLDHKESDDGKTAVYDDNIFFCPHCGTDVRQFDEPRYCPDCGRQIES